MKWPYSASDAVAAWRRTVLTSDCANSTRTSLPGVFGIPDMARMRGLVSVENFSPILSPCSVVEFRIESMYFCKGRLGGALR